MGSVFGPVRFLLPVCRFCLFLYTFNIHLYMHICRHIFLSNYWWQEFDIWSQASYRYAILWEAFLDPSGQIPTSCLPTLLIFIHIEHTFCICPFLVTFFSDIWSQASYRYPISWEAFFDPSDSYFLFAEERGYHKWALAHSSSCSIWTKPSLNDQQLLFILQPARLYSSKLYQEKIWSRNFWVSIKFSLEFLIW